MSLVVEIHWAGMMHGIPVVLARELAADQHQEHRSWLFGGVLVDFLTGLRSGAGTPDTDLLAFTLPDCSQLTAFQPGGFAALLPRPSTGAPIDRAILSLLLRLAASELCAHGARPIPGAPGLTYQTLAQTIHDEADAVPGSAAFRGLIRVFDHVGSTPGFISWSALGGGVALGHSIHAALLILGNYPTAAAYRP